MRKGTGLSGPVHYVRPEMHAGHREVMRLLKRITWICAGRGWEKSSFGVNYALDGIFGNEDLGIEGNEFVWWTSFTSEPIDSFIAETWRPLVFGEEIWDACYHKGERYLYLPGKKPMRFTSLQEARNQRGPTPDRIFVDEAGMCRRGDITGIILPMLFKSGGSVLGVGTPDPDDPLNDFYDFVAGPLPEEGYGAKNVARFIIPVVGAEVTKEGDLIRQPHPLENPRKSFEELRASYLSLPPSQRPAWEVEFLCAFKVGGSTQIQNVERVCTLEYVVHPEVDGECVLSGFVPRQGDQYVGGIDLAIGGKYEEEKKGEKASEKENWTVITVYEEGSAELVYFRRFLPRSNTPAGRWAQVYEAIARVHDLFPRLECNVDVTGEGSHVPETMLAQYNIQLNSFNFAGTAEKKNALMDALTVWIEGAHIRLFNHSQIKRECSLLRRIYREGQKPKIVAPKGENDDVPIALGLMLYGRPFVERAGEGLKELQKFRELVAAAQPPPQVSPYGYGSVAPGQPASSGGPVKLPTWEF